VTVPILNRIQKQASYWRPKNAPQPEICQHRICWELALDPNGKPHAPFFFRIKLKHKFRLSARNALKMVRRNIGFLKLNWKFTEFLWKFTVWIFRHCLNIQTVLNCLNIQTLSESDSEPEYSDTGGIQKSFRGIQKNFQKKTTPRLN
jgi:hypothetical protein